ncbi:sulfite exporter TauE/SafE family protein [Bowdeniella nasicola]|uniref:sulfite exporter TauE/SafE family protein n=1 Tax=Bowdeniella nasicola TaxID=208480 RepID=UPI00116131EF|nr:sulfite exporter TauE/SafE family protein [Bowdeniella nasicola]
MAAFILGGGLQRICGMGTGVVAGPILALAMGPVLGVLTTNTAAIVTAAVLTVSLRAHVDWRRVAIICVTGAIGIGIGVAVIHRVTSAWLEVVIATLLLAGLATTSIAARPRPGRAPQFDALGGGIGGVMNALVGMAGPILVLDSRLTGWEQQRFAASLQPIFLFLNIGSVLAKVVPGLPPGVDLPPWWVVPIVFASVLFGAWLGGRLAPRVSSTHARTLAILVASAGCITLLVRGASTLL